MQNKQRAERPSRAWVYLLLVIPFIAMLWVPSYSSATPALAGIPFFYWYQFAWVIISGILTAIVYLATNHEGANNVGRVVGRKGRANND